MTFRYSDDKPPLDEALLAHFGVKGMKWGVRKERKAAAANLRSLEPEIVSRATTRSQSAYTTQQKYSKLSNKDRIIKSGSVLKRTARDTNVSGPTYVSTNDKDAEIYRALIPTRGANWKPGKVVGKNYEITLQVTKDLKSPSEKTRIDAYTKLMGSREIVLGNGEVITGREYLIRSGMGASVNSLSNHQIALTHYGEFARLQGIKNEPLSSAYFKNLSAKGYNALVDDNDRNVLSKDPLLIFNNNGALKTLDVRRLSDAEILKAQATIKLPD